MLGYHSWPFFFFFFFALSRFAYHKKLTHEGFLTSGTCLVARLMGEGGTC